jgi:hypothetical protein
MPISGEDCLAGETFGEALPDQCPPETAEDLALADVYRLVASPEPDEECFKSKLALGIPKPDSYTGTDCEWASCSLSSSVDALLKIKGLRKRLKYVAKLQIPESAGRHLSEKAHIHFWRFSAFDITSAIESVEEHGRS